MFKKGNTDLLMISSLGGLGKSRLADNIMKEVAHVKILSHITPISLFIIGHENKDLPLIFDDVDILINNKENVSLLKQFCETSRTKEIGWATTSKILDNEDVPHKYETKSRVLIITNDFNKLNKNVGALVDRGWHIEFEPTTDEILNKISEIKNHINNGLSDEQRDEIFRLIERFAKFGRVTLRTFVKGCQLYKHCQGQDGWQEKLLSEMEIEPKLQIIDRLLSVYESDNERLNLWNSYGWSKRSFYDWKRKMMQKCIQNQDKYVLNSAAQLHVRQV